MPNMLEKNLPKTLRDRVSALISTALALFLALQYNETIKEIFEIFFPLDSGTFVGRILYIIILTIIIVYATVGVEKLLDGR